MGHTPSHPARELALQALSGHRQRPPPSPKTGAPGVFSAIAQPSATLHPIQSPALFDAAVDQPRFPSRGKPVSSSNRPQLHNLSLLIAAETLFDKLDIPLAIETYSSCPVTIITLFNIGQLYLYTLDYANARDYFTMAVKQEPNFAFSCSEEEGSQIIGN
jgi:hypothetical protein